MSRRHNAKVVIADSDLVSRLPQDRSEQDWRSVRPSISRSDDLASGSFYW